MHRIDRRERIETNRESIETLSKGIDSQWIEEIKNIKKIKKIKRIKEIDRYLAVENSILELNEYQTVRH